MIVPATRGPLVWGLVLTVLLGGLWLLCAGPGPDRTPAWTPDRGTLGPADRDALAAAPVDRGAAPAGPDPRVDFTDPAAVAAAYVAAGYGARDTDAGRTNRRAVPYAAPSTPPGTVGVLALTAPPPGHRRTAVVTEVTEGTEGSGGPAGGQRGYRVGYRLVDDLAAQRAADLPAGERQERHLELLRQFDGRWLVAGDTADGP
ncbi:MAG TPA: hypothetical protein VGH99_19995 [Pseudonocardia sp.]|jgi:hypothetical protein